MDSFSQSIQPLFRTIARFGWPVVVVEKILNDPSCTNTLFQDNFLDQTCLSLAISKTLGYVTIIGALMYKMPIIINILKQKSGAGLNVTSVYLETTAFLGLVAYNFKRNNEFSTYGDNISASIQSIVIIILMWAYGMGSKSKFSMAHILVVLGLGGAYCFSLVSAQEQHHAYIVSYAMGISTVSKVPQIIDNFKTGELGAQSSVTAGLAFFGTAAKLFIAMRETADDVMLVAGSGLAAALNIILFAQTLAYGSKKAQLADKKKKQ